MQILRQIPQILTQELCNSLCNKPTDRYADFLDRNVTFSLLINLVSKSNETTVKTQNSQHCRFYGGIFEKNWFCNNSALKCRRTKTQNSLSPAHQALNLCCWFKICMSYNRSQVKFTSSRHLNSNLENVLHICNYLKIANRCAIT